MNVVISQEVAEALERGFATFTYAAALREAVREKRCSASQAEVVEEANRRELLALSRLVRDDD